MITIERNELLDALNAVSKAVCGRTTMAILECVCLTTTGSTLILESNNMEFAIRKEIPCFSDKEAVCINAKRLLDILKKMPDTEITLEIDKSFAVTLSAGKTIKFCVPGLSPETFPFVKEEDGEKLIIEAEALKEAIAGVSFCTATTETNKLMTGIRLKSTGNKVNFCGLDGHRIGSRTITVAEAPERDYNITIPAAYLNEIVKILPSEDVEITINDKNIMLKVTDTTITTRLLAGEYFNIDQIIPHDSCMTSIKVNREQIYAAVDRALLILNDGTRRPVICTLDKDRMEVSGTSVYGTVSEEIEISDMTGKDIRIGFNPKFVIDALKAIPDDFITIEFFGAKAPIIIRNNETYLYLVLPVNISK